ncbi:MAG: MaoC/PaaZ C-terminal domain-containing protein, partial [Geminicoccaceae bacterium]|nr:MaoC/PaaZ C-terminal domain-containing protein [Geminicoccaceae bacterium]
MEERIENKTFEEIAIGDSASLVKAIGREDIELFAAVSGDANPIHLDEELAAKTPFKGVVAHGMLTAGLISNLLGNRLPGPGTIYLAQELRFHRPVRIGDVVTASVTVTEKRPDKRIVVFDCRVTNQRGEVVLTGTAEVIAPKDKLRGPAPELPQLAIHRHEKYERLIERTKGIPPIPCAVAHPCERHALEGALLAAERGIIVPVLVAPSG